MEGVVPVQSIDTSTLANKARQSLDFKPISVPGEVTSHSTPVSDATIVAPLVTPPTHPSFTIPHSQLPAGTINTGIIAYMQSHLLKLVYDSASHLYYGF